MTLAATFTRAAAEDCSALPPLLLGGIDIYDIDQPGLAIRNSDELEGWAKGRVPHQR